MSEHDDEGDFEHRDGVFEAAHNRVGDDLSSVSDDEQVAEALVEDDLRREARVGTAEERGTGALTSGQLVTTLDILPRV